MRFTSLLSPGLHADDPAREPRDETLFEHLGRLIRRRAALEGDAVDRSDVIERRDVAERDRALDRDERRASRGAALRGCVRLASSADRGRGGSSAGSPCTLNSICGRTATVAFSADRAARAPPATIPCRALDRLEVVLFHRLGVCRRHEIVHRALGDHGGTVVASKTLRGAFPGRNPGMRDVLDEPTKRALLRGCELGGGNGDLEFDLRRVEVFEGRCGQGIPR